MLALRVPRFAVDELDSRLEADARLHDHDPSHDPPAINRPFAELHCLAGLEAEISDHAHAGIADIAEFGGAQFYAVVPRLRQGEIGNDMIDRHSHVPAPVVGEQTLQGVVGLRNNTMASKIVPSVLKDPAGESFGLEQVKGDGYEDLHMVPG